MNKETERFNYFEKLLFRIHLGLIGSGFILFGLLYLLIDIIEQIGDIFVSIIVTALAAILISFFTSVIRIIRYFLKFKGQEGNIGIRRSIITMLTSPIAFIIYYIMLFILMLSMASCST
jgi:hypothetical protein